MTPSDNKGKHILLVEDDSTYRMVVLSMLRKAGFTSSFAVDGDDAVKKLEQGKFDLMIVDYLLPGLNGLEVVQWARNQNIDIPALVVTNFPPDELTLSNKTLGNTSIIEKMSFTPNDMLSIIKEIID